MKMQLNVALQQNLAAEDPVAVLDRALKECMEQLRHVREEKALHSLVEQRDELRSRSKCSNDEREYKLQAVDMAF
uniref:Uncharacterized protein n=1 Tax=Physcomitrium patens TaxID=3218 RepID=A0A2K1K335_PHYPA|nr:hypothetical protein PHYPA_012670 [Physcomitrium patens]